MAQVLTSKQTGFINRYTQQIQTLIGCIDALAQLKSEWDANAYATGATPVTNNITDAVIQSTAAYATASQLNQVIGAVESIRTTVAANRGYLEAMRP
jgi:hypothetical protein